MILSLHGGGSDNDDVGDEILLCIKFSLFFFFNLILICLVENLCFSPTTKTLFLYLIIILSAAAFYT